MPLPNKDQALGKRICDRILVMLMNEAIDAGALFRETVYDWADRHPDWAPEIRMWYDRWIELASPRIEGSIRLQRALRAKGVPVFALTNFGRYSFQEALPKMDFLQDFDKRYVSTIGTNGFANRGDSQTLLAGAPQQFFVTLRKDF